ncbi:MAG: hypothetical protein ABF743_01455 [Schleiferilactobacillus perolens]|uniref:hypothetical protein n=1 Tax=Schleiferilactobacillus perolens TaxID=100468 RepID=UPI0039E92AFD
MATRLVGTTLSVLMLGGTLLLGACSTQKTADTVQRSEIPTYQVIADYGIDVNNPKALVASVDYSFVGIVEQEAKTSYKDSVPLEQPNGKTKMMGQAHTHYKVQVLTNLKNKLVTDHPIAITKLGGIRKDHSAYDVVKGDALLKVGKIYVFNAYAQNDGSLLLSGKNSSVPVTDKSLKTANESKTVRVYQDAVNKLSVKERVVNHKASDGVE